MSTGSAQVKLKILDLSTRVPSPRGVSGAIVIACKKGPTNEPTLTASEPQLLDRYTPNGAVGIGFDTAHYSALNFLQKSDSLWVHRVKGSGATFSGLAIAKAGGTNTAVANIADPEARAFGADESFLITSANEGAWGADIAIKIVKYADNNELVGEPDAFAILVFKKGNLNDFVEKHICSLVQDARDGFNRLIFLENVLAGSAFIRGYVNPANDGTIEAQATGIFLGAGNDGATATTSDYVNGLGKFSNKNKFDITIVMDGGYTVPAYQQAIAQLCEARQDCVGILSMPFASSKVADALTYRKTTLNLNSSYVALYAPHVKMFDKFNNRDIFVSPDGYVASAISQSASNFEIWFPSAGYRRGVIIASDLQEKYEDGELDALYNAGINPIKFAVGRGIVIWGNKTLSSRPSALDRLNVMLLLITIGPSIKTFLEDFLFELNDDTTRTLIKEGINDYMELVKAKRGVYNFLTVCDDTNNTPVVIDNNQLAVDLYIQPSRAVEEIPFRIIVTNTGADLSSLSA